MHLHVLSDLHIEFAPFEPASPATDSVILLAGDTHTGLRGLEWAAHSYQGWPVVYILGNHEFYGHTAPDLISKAQARGTELGVHVLSDSMVVLNGVRFVGATLWTDFALFGKTPYASIAAQQRMTDFRRIRVSPRYRRLRPEDTVLWFSRSVRFLRGALRERFDGPTVVLTHHAPSARSVAPNLAVDELSAAYASNLDDLVAESGAALWVHGHTHHNSSYVLGQTRVITNQRGYPDEPVAGFDPNMLVHL